jgi:hypothetical protein
MTVAATIRRPVTGCAETSIACQTAIRLTGDRLARTHRAESNGKTPALFGSFLFLRVAATQSRDPITDITEYNPP